MKKVDNSIATKLRVTLLKNFNFFEIFLLHYTIQWINCVVNDLNVKINWNLLRNLLHSFEVHSNESACRKVDVLG